MVKKKKLTPIGENYLFARSGPPAIWGQGLEPDLSGPMKITIEHDGMGDYTTVGDNAPAASSSGLTLGVLLGGIAAAVGGLWWLSKRVEAEERMLAQRAKQRVGRIKDRGGLQFDTARVGRRGNYRLPPPQLSME